MCVYPGTWYSSGNIYYICSLAFCASWSQGLGVLHSFRPDNQSQLARPQFSLHFTNKKGTCFLPTSQALALLFRDLVIIYDSFQSHLPYPDNRISQPIHRHHPPSALTFASPPWPSSSAQPRGASEVVPHDLVAWPEGAEKEH